MSQYLCSVKQKMNISSLQTTLKQEEESIRDFTMRFGQDVQQIELYSMDAVLQNFRRSFGPSTPFFQSLYYSRRGVDQRPPNRGVAKQS